eukprot:CAMPEP_0204289806 /NCGR_PEP_ID=MMETSP0468-20130131/59326_1 /ASSEMBLY_ACC=CAM_ASM_000383 /TAXON_ID=2969 /ORGANISM="Oxyrrhis marina" /LENGTH=125 /DNA_ID=CAMNT_0051267987 /DNA_START=328 /DNA_END=705 /DNA_ORIENTATION=+
MHHQDQRSFARVPGSCLLPDPIPTSQSTCRSRIFVLEPTSPPASRVQIASHPVRGDCNIDVRKQLQNALPVQPMLMVVPHTSFFSGPTKATPFFMPVKLDLWADAMFFQNSRDGLHRLQRSGHAT